MTLYDYQEEAITKCLENDKGIICLPTGTGKTIIQSALLSRIIKSNPGFSIYVVNAPRIILTYQLMLECYQYLVEENIECKYMFVHSGGSVDIRDIEKIRENSEIPYIDTGSGTSKREIEDSVDKAKQLNVPLILFSTYHSCNRIQEALKDDIEIIINDEAHYLVQEQFHKIFTEVQSKRWYFFTATMINTPSNSGRGMNNSKLYGEVLYSMTPREAIERGKMVRPRLHLITTKGVHTMEEYNGSINKVIKHSFLQHKSLLISNPKLLVTVKGTQHMLNWIKSKEYQELRSLGVEIFCISSNEDIGNNINGVKYSRQDFLKTLKSYGKDTTKSMIVLHFDIIAEGVDISGFTGILPMRTLSKSKFLQTYGRAARLDPYDRERLTSNEISSTDLDEMTKPYSYVILPNVVHDNEDDTSFIRNIINELRSYEFNPYEDIISSSIINGTVQPELLNNLNKINTKNKSIGNLIEHYEVSLEDERIANLQEDKWLNEMIE